MIDKDPRFLVSRQQEVKAGSSLILPVNFTCTPAPKVTWSRNGVPLHNMPGHVHVDVGDNYSTLTVMGIEKDEAGKYEVHIENVAGAADTDFDVTVKGKTSFIGLAYIYSYKIH